MSERLFLYIDILGFKELIQSGFDVSLIYERINDLNVHSDRDFGCIVFSDTILVHADEAWLKHPSSGIMWLIEFAQDLFYRLISIDVHIRAYITKGNFEYHKLENLEAYYGEALIKCYEREKEIKCTGVFLDKDLAPYSDIFKLTKYDDKSYYVHVMQHLDDISWEYKHYPLSGEMLLATGMEWWVAYLLIYMKNTFSHANDKKLSDSVRLKHQNAWKMISAQHPGLTKRLEEADFDFGRVVDIDWSEPLRRIGTKEGAWA